MLGGRPVSLILSEARQASNYRALWRMRRVYPDFRESARRYFLARGAYPYRCPLRTPVGLVRPTLYSHHDAITLNEIFCREDYQAGTDLGVVVDVGSNIGLSALYFLTRNHSSRCHLYEPVPRNLARLHENLAGYESRFSTTEAAVDERSGSVSFGIEESGRYGGIDAHTAQRIEVDCLDINGVLEGVLREVETIDVLKLDTEGAEQRTVQAIALEHLARIRTIYLEWPVRVGLHEDLFDARFASQTICLTNRRLALM